MTLDELLDLLPDNVTGQISAADMRTIVTDLWTASNTLRVSYEYEWNAGDTSPAANGQATLDAGWSPASVTLFVNDNDQGGRPMAFGSFPPGRDVNIAIAGDGFDARLSVTGPPVDVGLWHTVPVSVLSMTGVAPIATTPFTLVVEVLP